MLQHNPANFAAIRQSSYRTGRESRVLTGVHATLFNTSGRFFGSKVLRTTPVILPDFVFTSATVVPSLRASIPSGRDHGQSDQRGICSTRPEVGLKRLNWLISSRSVL